MASSSASLVPEPMAKCAVCAASPINTTWPCPLKWLHLPQVSRAKFSQAAQMPGVAYQLGAIQDFGKQILAERDGSGFVGLVETVRFENIFRGFDDESRRALIEFVDVRLEPAVLGAAKIEGKGIKQLVGTEPNETIRPHDQVGLEELLIPVAYL